MSIETYVWNGVAPSDMPVNSALLAGAKLLLRGVYQYQNGVDYLPVSYSDCNPLQTQYVVHAMHPSYATWPNSQAWASVPAGAYSGQVVAGNPAATTQCWTDCSGFITALFSWVNTETQTKTQFGNWATGALIPEAGCFDPQGGCNLPNAENYFALSKSGKGFTSPQLSGIEPGDLIIYASGSASAGDTGHIMLVAAVATLAPGQNYQLPNGGEFSAPNGSNPTLVVVIDQTQDPHSDDTRGMQRNYLPEGDGQGIGVGMGIVLLYQDSSGTLQFCWSAGVDPMSVKAPTSAVLLGRAMLA